MKNPMIRACALLAVLGTAACSSTSESAPQSASGEKLGVSAAALGVDGGVDGGADAGDVVVVDAGDAGQ